MNVSDVMTQASVTESPSDTLRAAAVLMWRQQTGSLAIVDGDTLVGIITERDVLRAVAQGVDLDSTTVGDAMTKHVITVASDVPLRDASRLMAQHWIRHLPVVDGDKLVGVLSQRDVAGIFAALWRVPDVPAIDTDDLVRARRLARIEHGDLD